jgi:hypothetical protein
MVGISYANKAYEFDKKPWEIENPQSGYLDKILGVQNEDYLGGALQPNAAQQESVMADKTEAPAPAASQQASQQMAPTRSMTKTSVSGTATTPANYSGQMDWLQSLLDETKKQEGTYRDAQNNASLMSSLGGLADVVPEIPLQFGGIMAKQAPTKMPSLQESFAAPAKAQATMEKEKLQSLLDKYKTAAGLKESQDSMSFKREELSEQRRHNMAEEGIARSKPASGDNLKEYQARALQFAASADQANAELEALSKAGFNKANYGTALRQGIADKTSGFGGNAIRSGQGAQWKAAQWKFLNAIMRDESGAAIPEEEYSKYEPIFFPMAGEDQNTINMKAEHRRQAIENLRTKGGQPNQFIQWHKDSYLKPTTQAGGPSQSSPSMPDIDKMSEAELDSFIKNMGNR